MSSVTSVAADRLRHILTLGKKRAEDLGQSVLASLTYLISTEIDSVKLFCTANRLGYVANYWAHPNEDTRMVGVGEVAKINSEGRGRFKDAATIINGTVKSAIIEGNAGLGPVFMGGFRFYPRSQSGGIWAEFSDCLLSLPRLMVRSKDPDHRWITLNVILNGHTDVETLQKELTAEVAALFQSSPDLEDSVSSATVEEESPDQFRVSVGRALQGMKDGRLRKVTLARTSMVHSKTPIRAGTVLRNLEASYPECRVFAFCRGGTSFVGASPEVLVSLQNGSVTSTCLAGSVSRGLTESEDSALSAWLLASLKEREEHEIVVDWVAERMGKLCNGLKWNDVPRVLKLGNVQHLQTTFEGKPKEGCTALTFVQALHPTPAVGGIPLEEALQMIEQLETADRGWYTGPVGWVDEKGFGDFAIAIRCALLNGNEALLYAGDGIVVGSDPEREYQETKVKFKPLLSALGVER